MATERNTWRRINGAVPRLAWWGRETEMQEREHAAAVAAWASSVPVDQIPSLLALLSARLVSEGSIAPTRRGIYAFSLLSSSNSALASFRSAVSKPSVNCP